ncbi:hypothetical protein J1N35_006625 [Gossypium stocksii]|uniref:Uncharacterized protein n=1 Tax=Gossypium stocksii TaxID=47602 RepID=A0A9D4ACQ1_9ROSI|nr:hypothetical protein J1N35_006625 [Gossypium stocksii]
MKEDVIFIYCFFHKDYNERERDLSSFLCFSYSRIFSLSPNSQNPNYIFLISLFDSSIEACQLTTVISVEESSSLFVCFPRLLLFFSFFVPKVLFFSYLFYDLPLILKKALPLFCLCLNFVYFSCFNFGFFIVDLSRKLSVSSVNLISTQLLFFFLQILLVGQSCIFWVFLIREY